MSGTVCGFSPTTTASISRFARAELVRTAHRTDRMPADFREHSSGFREIRTSSQSLLGGRVLPLPMAVASAMSNPEIQTPYRSIAQADDDELVRRATGGGTEAFGELVRRHEPRIVALLMRLTRGDRVLTEDLTQEAFLRAYRGLPGFEGRSRFSTWVHRIAYFAFLNHRNRVPTHARLPEGFENMAVAPEGELSPAHSDLRRDMAAAVESLPDRYRMVIELHFMRHVPYRDIADELNLPLGTVKTQLFRAKAMLRDRMTGWTANVGSYRAPIELAAV